ncbi:MAG: hypothetical protein O2816_06725 [Planctomycetota bacterium]|nr:hypothetical protein [Planctomycetota bacterium]
MRRAIFLLLLLACATVLWTELLQSVAPASNSSVCLTGSGDHALHASERLHVSVRAGAPDQDAQKAMLFEAWVLTEPVSSAEATHGTRRLATTRKRLEQVRRTSGSHH